MNINLFERLEQSLVSIGQLKEYLQTSIETNEKNVTITVKNVAPENPTLPRVVFIGVALSVAGAPSVAGIVDIGVLARRHLKVTRNVSATEATNLSKQRDEKYFRLLNPSFKYVKENQVGLTSDEAQRGEQLFPGQSITFEMEIPPNGIPYLQFRIEGILSQHHLFYGRQLLTLPDSYTKPLAMDGLKSFNALQIHKVLIDVTSHMPAFDGNTRFSDVQAFNDSLTAGIADIESATKPLNDLFHKHKFPWFQAHLHATFNYLELVKKTLKRVQDVISSNDLYQIHTETNKLKGELVEEAYQLNRDTEALMLQYKLSDQDVDYKYRGGIEAWNKLAEQHLQSIFSNPKLWLAIPDLARRSLVDAKRAWDSGSNARSESILNELRITAEQLLFHGLWSWLESWEGFQEVPEWHKQKFVDLKAEFLENGPQPSFLCLQRACELQVTNAYLRAKGVSEEETKWFAEQLPVSLNKLRRARNQAEHEGKNISHEELMLYVDECLGIPGKPGILYRIARILF